MRRQATRYELALTHETTGEVRRLCYTARRSRKGLIDAVCSNGAALAALAGTADFIVPPKKGDGAAKLGAWRIAFTGRTAREASGSELRWFQEAAK